MQTAQWAVRNAFSESRDGVGFFAKWRYECAAFILPPFSGLACAGAKEENKWETGLLAVSRRLGRSLHVCSVRSGGGGGASGVRPEPQTGRRASVPQVVGAGGEGRRLRKPSPARPFPRGASPPTVQGCHGDLWHLQRCKMGAKSSPRRVCQPFLRGDSRGGRRVGGGRKGKFMLAISFLKWGWCWMDSKY